MTDTQEVKALCMKELEFLAGQGNVDAKRELARRSMKEGVDKNEEKAVALLEDYVALGDAEAMVMLAKCCALGLGMEYNVKRAESLISEAAKRGNEEARRLIGDIDEWKGKESINLMGLPRTHWK